jgi:hypothetical protein
MEEEIPKEIRGDDLESKTDEQLNNPSTDVSIVPTDKKSDIINPTDIKEMEVHHHTHPSHGKKTWKEYFWEFLMLFLAVFCGFLAEYQLEHMIERDREKKFIQTFIEDLKTDTASIRQILIFRNRKMERMDSLIFLLKTQQIKGHENEIYFFGRTLIRSNRFQSNDRTITQLKNSGALRLIRNEQAADSMITYQKLVELIYLSQEDDRIERRAADPILSRMFSPFVLNDMITIDGVNRISGNPPLRSYDPAIQQDLAYYIHQIKGSNFLIQARLELLNKKANNLIVFLQKEYHLK